MGKHWSEKLDNYEWQKVFFFPADYIFSFILLLFFVFPSTLFQFPSPFFHCKSRCVAEIDIGGVSL
jgi:hypothetical protein